MTHSRVGGMETTAAGDSKSAEGNVGSTADRAADVLETAPTTASAQTGPSAAEPPTAELLRKLKSLKKLSESGTLTAAMKGPVEAQLSQLISTLLEHANQSPDGAKLIGEIQAALEGRSGETSSGKTDGKSAASNETSAPDSATSKRDGLIESMKADCKELFRLKGWDGTSIAGRFSSVVMSGGTKNPLKIIGAVVSSVALDLIAEPKAWPIVWRLGVSFTKFLKAIADEKKATAQVTRTKAAASRHPSNKGGQNQPPPLKASDSVAQLLGVAPTGTHP